MAHPLMSVAVVAGLFGLMVGSHLTLVSHRAPIGEPLTHSAPHCPSCHARVRARDEIPVLSFLVLKGRCRACGSPISARYPLIELSTGAVFAALGLRFAPSFALLGELVAFAGLLALAVTDVEHRLVPRRIVYAVAVAVCAVRLVAAAVPYGAPSDLWRRLLVSLAVGATATAIFWAVHAVTPSGLRFGDVRVAGLVGLVLGWASPLTAFAGFVVALSLGVAWGAVLSARRRTTRVAVPLAPFLAAGSLAAVMVPTSTITSIFR